MRIMHTIHPHPQSLLNTVAGGRWLIPLLNLFWLVYVAIGGLFLSLNTLSQTFTWASLPVFLALYAGAWLDDRARLWRYTALIAALGLANVAVNSIYSYLIYAASLVMFCGSRRTAWLWLAALLAAFVAVALNGPFFNTFSVGFGVTLCVVVAAFNQSFRDQAQRDAALRLTHEELRRMAASAERERIGRDLHDTLGATLALIAVKSELAGRLFERDTQQARAQVADIEQVAREALAQVRQAVAGIRAAVLAGEVASARLLLESSGVAFAADVDPLPLPAATESALALALREAATNVQRHARAQAVRVTLRREGAAAVLSVEDNGRGAAIKAGHGLRGMQERVQAVGGTLQIESSTGGTSRGTRLRLCVPLPGAAASGAAPTTTNPAPRLAAGACA